MAQVNTPPPMFVVLGGSQPGLRTSAPWILAGDNSPSFPLMIQCRDHEEAKNVFRLQADISAYLRQNPFASPLQSARYLRDNPLLREISTEINRSVYYAAYNSSRIGVYLDGEVFMHYYNGAKFQKHETFPTLVGAICYMVSKKAMRFMDKLHANEPTTEDNDLNIQDGGETLGEACLDTSTTVTEATESSLSATDAASVPGSPSPSNTSGVQRQNQEIPAEESTLNENAPVHSRVLKNVRGLSGLISTITDPFELIDHDTTGAVNFGPVINSYLHSHGFRQKDITFIDAAYTVSTGIEDFADLLCKKGMSETEASWIWNLAKA